MILKTMRLASEIRSLITARRWNRSLFESLPNRNLKPRLPVEKVNQLKLCIGVLVSVVALSFAMIEPVAGETKSVTGTKHDFSMYGNIFDTTDACVVCHILRSSPDTMLSPRSVPGTFSGFQLYTSNTIDSFVDEPGIGSVVCLSCHDGETAFDALNGSYGTASNNMSSHFKESPAIIGTDLRNDHPIGVAITADFGGIRDESAIRNAGLKIHGGKVECTTCHDPHGSDGYPFFLRMDPYGAPLCLVCHIK